MQKLYTNQLSWLLLCFSQACKLLAGLIPKREEKDQTTLTREHYERLYIFTLMWSIGAYLELDDRAKMEEYMRNSEDFKLDMPVIPQESEATMFEYLVDEKGNICTQFCVRCISILTPKDHFSNVCPSVFLSV